MTPSRSLPLSPTSTPSMPSGGTALRSMATCSVGHASAGGLRQQHDAGGPGGEDQRALRQRGRQVVRPGDGDRLQLGAGDLGLDGHRPRRRPVSRCREARRTSAPCARQQQGHALADRPGAAQDQRLAPATGRGAGRPRARRRRRWCWRRWRRAAPTRAGRTAAACARCTSASSRSPAATSLPPMKKAVRCRSFGPRVKMAPWTMSRTCLRLDAAVAEHLVGAGVDGHDAVEHARVRRRCRAGSGSCACPRLIAIVTSTRVSRRSRQQRRGRAPLSAEPLTADR